MGTERSSEGVGVDCLLAEKLADELMGGLLVSSEV